MSDFSNVEFLSYWKNGQQANMVIRFYLVKYGANPVKSLGDIWKLQLGRGTPFQLQKVYYGLIVKELFEVPTHVIIKYNLFCEVICNTFLDMTSFLSWLNAPHIITWMENYLKLIQETSVMKWVSKCHSKRSFASSNTISKVFLLSSSNFRQFLSYIGQDFLHLLMLIWFIS